MSGKAPVQGALGLIAELYGDRPRSAAIEISDRCNEVCVHCYQVQGQKGEMDTGELLALLDRLASAGVLYLTLSGGEATLRHDFLEIVSHARRRGFLVTLFTNGLTMTEALADALAKLGVFSVEISLYAIDAETHDFVTGVPGSFERTTAGIKHLTARNVHVRVKTPVMSVNESQLAAYRHFATTELGAEVALSYGALHGREGGDLSPLALNASDHGMLHTDDPEMIAARQAYQPTPPGDRPVCGAARGYHVEPDGTLQPCEMLQVDLGDARSGDPAALSGGERARDIRAITWRDLHGCRDCALGGHCNRCYAAGLEEAGDALGPYPSACRGARLEYAAHTGRPLDPAAPALGPYQLGPDGVLSSVPDRVTAADEALAARLGWARRPDFVAPTRPASAGPGELVQLRRPGRKRAAPHRLPGGGRRAAQAQVQDDG